MRRFLVSFAIAAASSAVSLPAWADKIAVLPFTSSNNVPRPELEEARKWTREAAVKAGHAYATDSEMVSAEGAVKDGVADTSSEYIAAGRAAHADWTLTGRVERHDHPSARLPDGKEEEGYSTYRLELEACQVSTGRVESLSREVLPDDAPKDISEMIALLVRPGGIAGAEIPWRGEVKHPKPRVKPPPPPPPEPPPSAPAPAPPPTVAVPYGAEHPIALGASIGFTTALARPDQALGPSTAMPLGAAFAYALPDTLAGLELRGVLTSQVIGPRAVEVSAGARYALAPAAGSRFFLGPELLAGAHVPLGADKSARFLMHPAFFVALGVTENVQAEVAADLIAAVGGAGTLVLGGATARILVRF